MSFYQDLFDVVLVFRVLGALLFAVVVVFVVFFATVEFEVFSALTSFIVTFFTVVGATASGFIATASGFTAVVASS